VERLFRFIRERFLVEIETGGVGSLQELNDKFAAWAESVANTRVHAETQETPIARFLSQGPPVAADPALMAEAFRWSALRVVSKTFSGVPELSRGVAFGALEGGCSAVFSVPCATCVM
jgi:hypothetical protein